MISIPRDIDEQEDDRILFPVGRYLVSIVRVKETETECDLSYRFIDGDNPSMNGQVAVERFSLSIGAIPKLKCILKRVGLVDRGDPTENAQYDPQDLVGAMLVIDMVHEEVKSAKGNVYTKSQWKWGSGWKPDDAQSKSAIAAGVPEWIAKRRIPGRETQRTAAPAAQPAATATNYDDV